jgi:hypothetical protein
MQQIDQRPRVAAANPVPQSSSRCAAINLGRVPEQCSSLRLWTPLLQHSSEPGWAP